MARFLSLRRPAVLRLFPMLHKQWMPNVMAFAFLTLYVPIADGFGVQFLRPRRLGANGRPVTCRTPALRAIFSSDPRSRNELLETFDRWLVDEGIVENSTAVSVKDCGAAGLGLVAKQVRHSECYFAEFCEVTLGIDHWLTHWRSGHQSGKQCMQDSFQYDPRVRNCLGSSRSARRI
jgi:hypothetical protein